MYKFADDNLGSTREHYESPLPEGYIKAFHAIDGDPNIRTIEGVRIVSPERSKGLGSQLIRYAIERVKERGRQMVQLTTDKKRVDALRFYERLGFKASHEGLELHLLTTQAGVTLLQLTGALMQEDRLKQTA